MQSELYIPNSIEDARQQLQRAKALPVDGLTKTQFLRVWCSIAYLFPGLHPDGYEESDSGWSPSLRRFAGEAWRRADAGELAEEELYPSDVQWAGLYDRMSVHTPDEIERRLEIARSSGLTRDG